MLIDRLQLRNRKIGGIKTKHLCYGVHLKTLTSGVDSLLRGRKAKFDDYIICCKQFTVIIATKAVCSADSTSAEEICVRNRYGAER